MKRAAGAVAALPLFLCPSVLAQELGSRRAIDTGAPAWMLAWSPLRPIADHARDIPRAPELPRLLIASERELGLLWSIGNLGAAPFEVPGRWNELRLAGAADDGEYRRPMDPADVEVLQFSGLGWEPVGSGGAAVGRVALDREKAGLLEFADLLEPHSSSPLVVADSSVSDMRRLRARFEGGFGWRFGRWGIGAAAGIETRDHRGERSALPRVSRMSAAGLSLGVVGQVPFAGVKLGGHVRWRRDVETSSVFARLRDAVVFQLQGYAEPAPLEVKPPAQIYFRRLESEAWLWGLSAAGRLAASEWVIAVEQTERADGQHSAALSADPSEDRWEADGTTVSGAVQRALSGERLLLSASARYSTLDGDATLADLEGIVFRASEEAFEGAVDVRYARAGWPWSAGLTLSLRRESRFRRDFVSDVFTDVESWTPGFGVEVARDLGASTRLSAAYAIGFYSATASIPNPESMGPVYRLLIAPEMSLYGTESRPNRAALSWRQSLGARSALLLRAERETAAPHDVEDGLAFAPRGRRTVWRLSFSLLLTD